MTKDPLLMRSGANVYAYVHDDPMNAIDPTGLSVADQLKIVHRMERAVDDMDRGGQRMEAKGQLSASINNFLATLNGLTLNGLGLGYMGCKDQALDMLGQLIALSDLDDQWSFQLAGANWPHVQNGFGFTGNHWYVEAYSSNPHDPVIVLDPWRDEYRLLDRGDVMP
jgi:hypothetical protein